MIRGINRQVVEVKETGCEYFEKIMFFVKPEYASVSEGKIRERAGMIAGGTERPPTTKVKHDKRADIIKILGGVLLGFAIGITAAMLL
ncbi:MAG: hypothetical protein IJ491_03590 [Clostridia bacterium]|nr:hypothetical protein [Clostridia bacterium]